MSQASEPIIFLNLTPAGPITGNLQSRTAPGAGEFFTTNLGGRKWEQVPGPALDGKLAADGRRNIELRARTGPRARLDWQLVVLAEVQDFVGQPIGLIVRTSAHVGKCDVAKTGRGLLNLRG